MIIFRLDLQKTDLFSPLLCLPFFISPYRRSLPIDRCRHSRKGQPLCMEQYYRLFTSYRYPGKTKDNLVTTTDRDPFDPEHIIVACLDQVSKIF